MTDKIISTPETVLDMQRARTVELTVTAQGRVWLNIDGVCTVRIQASEVVVTDDPDRGRWNVNIDSAKA